MSNCLLQPITSEGDMLNSLIYWRKTHLKDSGPYSYVVKWPSFLVKTVPEWCNENKQQRTLNFAIFFQYRSITLEPFL